MRPGATTRNPRVNFLLFGRRTALMVCQAISIAMTVVLPAPVASFSAKAHQFGIGVIVGIGQVLEKAFAGLTRLGQPPSARSPSRPLRPDKRKDGCC